MSRNCSTDEQYRRYVPVASDGTFLCRVSGRFWFVPNVNPSDFRASTIIRVTSTVNKAIKSAAEFSAAEIANMAIKKASKPE